MSTTMRPSMRELGATYATARLALSDMLRGLSPEDLERPVPATPAWRVRDVAAHLCGAAADLRHGRLDDLGSEAWTDAHISSRRSRSVEEILDEWEGHGRVLEASGFKRPQASGLLDTIVARTDELGWDWRSLPLGDMVVHSQDIAGALRRPPDHTAPGTTETNEFYVRVALHLLVSLTGLPALRIRTANLDAIVGSGEATATLRCDDYELTRAIAGRRSADQIAAFEWDTDPAPYIAAFTPYALRSTPLTEQ